MGADFRLEDLPVVTIHSVQPNHVDLSDQVTVVLVPCVALQDVHLDAGSHQDGTADVLFEELLLHVGETVEQLCGALVVANVE